MITTIRTGQVVMATVDRITTTIIVTGPVITMEDQVTLSVEWVIPVIFGKGLTASENPITLGPQDTILVILDTTPGIPVSMADTTDRIWERFITLVATDFIPEDISENTGQWEAWATTGVS